jgi:hypothetical protein
MKVILPRPCPICGDPFTPDRRQLTTPRLSPPCCSRACLAQWQGQLKRGRPLVQALRARKRLAKQRAEAAAQAKFGALTSREVALFNYAAEIGYDRGYNAAYHKLRKGQAA